MSDPITLPAPVVNLPPAPRTKWEREYQAFQRLSQAYLALQWWILPALGVPT